jgi:hypothetical protein
MLNQSCDDCRRWIFSDRHEKLTRNGQPVVRPPQVPTPCAECPKRHRAAGRWFDAHVDQLAWLVRRHCEAVASGGGCLTHAERADTVLHRNLTLVAAVMRQLEREALIRAIGSVSATKGGRA